MAFIVPDTAKILMLKYILNVLAQDGGAAPAGGERLLRLFSNNLTPDDNTVIGDITEVSGSTGYVPITLAGASWTVSATTNVGLAVYSEQPFNVTAATTIYGYYITTTEGTPKLLWIERFVTGAPWVFGVDGGDFTITPKISLDQS